MSLRVLGLDGGGTKTLVAVAGPSGHVNLVTGGGVDPTAGDGWEGRLAALVAGLGPVDAAVLGLPYFSEVPAISARQVALAARVFGHGAQVRNDVDVAFEGALAGADGVLILAGTGSMAWGRGPRGVRRCGGFGDVFGDEGSAYWIGREALALVSRQLDGRVRAADFAGGILAALGVAGAGLIDWTYGQPHPRAAIAGLAVVVAGLADGGNREARALLARAALQLAALARGAGWRRGDNWSYAGGVLGNATLRGMVAARLGCDPVAPVLPPVGGAVLVAAQAAGWDTGPGFIQALARSLRQAGQFKE